MAKQTGLGDRLFVGGFDLSSDTGSVKSVTGGMKPIDVTGIDKSAHERIGGARDGKIEWSSFFNPTSAHPVLAALPRTDVGVSYAHGTAIGNPAAGMVAKQIDYPGNRSAAGHFTFDVNSLANGFGLEWGVQLTAGLKTDTVATNGTGLDLVTVSTSFGWQAYLHVTAFTGTSATVTVQDSADNISFASLTGGAFTAATGPTFQRLQSGSTDTVRRYVRAITTGTFSSVTFYVMFVRNEVAVTF